MEKIIQIIPAPDKMRAHFENTDPDALRDKNGNPVAMYAPVACLALVETENGDQEVKAMVTAHQQSNLVFVDEHDEFLFLTDD